MILTVRLQSKEARALTAMCRRFGFADAQHLLTGARNVNPTSLCEAVTTILNALDAASLAIPGRRRLPCRSRCDPGDFPQSDDP